MSLSEQFEIKSSPSADANISSKQNPMVDQSLINTQKKINEAMLELGKLYYEKNFPFLKSVSRTFL